METLAQDLFLQAVELNPAARDAFLSRSCGGKAQLRIEVEQLLDEARRADSFLGATDGATLSADAFENACSEMEGDQVGPYKLRQQIGEGGFGVVWMAEQTQPISRMVALKVVKAGMDTKQVLARFEAERQALAMMDHPHIAKVLDAGATASGRPYFAMELVRGIPITRFCDEARLGPRERLELFGDVCAAINHAHQKGVIHRDIKPTNVMVTLHGDKAVVKVIDFGIAKATQGKLTDHTLFTRFEQFIGTPVYMSPEQASLSGLDIDTRSDIYALGILLYELLTGKPPFDAQTLASAGYDEMRRIIREVEPPKPSSRLCTIFGEERGQLARARHVEPEKLGRLVEPDLDWIVMKAIEKDRSRRYETANGLALDIRRFLADEPVTARPPTTSYQLQKFARRNRVALRVACGIVALLVGAAVVSTWQAVRATRAEVLARSETERASTAEQRAIASLAEVEAERDAKELALKEAETIATFLGEVFQSPDPARDGRTITVAETLDAAAEKLEIDLADQPLHCARLQAALGRSYSTLGLYREAIALEEKARNFGLAAFGPEDPGTLITTHNLAMSYAGAGRWAEALQLREDVLERCRKIYGKDDPETIAAMEGLADSLSSFGRKDEALAIHRQVLEHRRQTLGAEHPDTLSAMNNVANSLSETAREDEALPMREEILALRRKVNGPEHPDTLKAMGNLANSYDETDRKDEALALREAVLPIRQEILGPEHPGTLMAMDNLALSYAAMNRKEEALKLWEELLPLSRKVNGSGHPYTLETMHGMANFLGNAGEQDKALALREEILPLRRQVLGPEHPESLAAMTNLSISLAAAGRLDEAIQLQEESLAVKRRVLAPPHPYLMVSLEVMAYIYDRAGRGAAALKLQEEVATLHREFNGPEHAETIRVDRRLADAYFAAGRTAEAVPLMADVSTRDPSDTLLAMDVAAWQSWLGMDAEHEVTSRRMIAWAATAQKPEDVERAGKLTCIRPIADPSLRKAVLELVRRAVKEGKDSPWLAYFQISLGMAEFRDGGFAEAEKILRPFGPANEPSVIMGATAQFYRAMTLFRLGRADEARGVFAAASARMSPPPADDAELMAGKPGHDVLILWLACKEARTLLGLPPATSP
jgi:serine/threonine protein kinase